MRLKTVGRPLKRASIQLTKTLFSLPLLITLAYAASNKPAQGPLVSWSTMAAPNVMIVFDTSLSMGKSYIPENALNDLTGGSYTTGSGGRVTFHPDDYVSSRTNYNGMRGGAKWFIPTEIDDPQAAAMAAVMRSPQHNLMYYDPRATYSPWLDADGKSMGNIDPVAAPVTVMRHFQRGTGTKDDGPLATVDLTGSRTYNFNSSSPTSSRPFPERSYRYYMVWHKNLGSRYDNATLQGEFKVTPSTYFIYKYGAPRDLNKNNASNLVNMNNYTRVAVPDISKLGLNISALYRSMGYNTENAQAANYVKVLRPDCSLLAGDYVCSKEQEYQNFANWFSYYRSRTLAGAGALTHVLFRDYDFNFRYGWADFNQRSSNVIDGVKTSWIRHGVREASASHNDRLLNWIAEIEGKTDETTPTRAALGAAGLYFSRTDNAGPWGAEPGTNDSTPQLACRRNFSIVITDGRWNSTAAAGASSNTSLKAGDPISGPDGQFYQYTPEAPYKGHKSSVEALSDVALHYWYQDLRPDMPNTIEPTPDNPAFWQNMVTHVVAFGLYSEGVQYPDDWERLKTGDLEWPRAFVATSNDGEEGRTADMWHTAINGHGAYIPSSNPAELIDSLTSVMENLSVTTVKAANVTSKSNELTLDNMIFVPSYTTVSWSGDLVAHALNNKGEAGKVIWSASERMPVASQRNIIIGTGNSSTGSKVVDFKWEALPSDLKAIFSNEDVVNYLRGDIKYEGSRFRARDSILGDIINSTPVYTNTVADVSVRGDRIDNIVADRIGIVFVGANDGMLHAFATDKGADQGKEVFAFIPRAVAENLPNLTSHDYSKQHLYFVDGGLNITDAQFAHCAVTESLVCWNQVLMGTAGAGAKSVFALDTTNPATFAKTANNTPTPANLKKTVLWELTSDSPKMGNLGYAMQAPEAGRINNPSSNPFPGTLDFPQWVAVFANGPYSETGQASLFITDIETGAFVREIKVGEANNNGLMAVTLVKKDDYILFAYAGDLKGNIWKFDLRSDTPADWHASKVFTAHQQRPIAHAPKVSPHPYGGYMVLFGTGKFYDSSDLEEVGLESIYGIWDNGTGTELLARKVTSTTIQGHTYYKLLNPNEAMDWAKNKGWYINLNMATGLRSLYSPTIVGTDVIFDVSITSDDSGIESCEVKTFGGITFKLNLLSGGNSSGKWDTNNNGVIDDKDGDYIGKETGENGSGVTLYPPGLNDVNEVTPNTCPNGSVWIVHNGGMCKPIIDTKVHVQLR